MQYIEKQQHPPEKWDDWFSYTNAHGALVRSYDYKKDYGSMKDIGLAKEYLLNEQHGLCAYCQSPLKPNDASIEHIIPKSENTLLSTAYHNLVAVCKQPAEDPKTKRYHCDKERGASVLLPLVLYKSLQADSDGSGHLNGHKLFQTGEAGKIAPKEAKSIAAKSEIENYIETLNLNHATLCHERQKAIKELEAAFAHIKTKAPAQYWKLMAEDVLKNPEAAYRQYKLCYIAKRLGRG